MPDLSIEQKYGYGNGKIICGVDEVGRGPLAGPVMAAAVILPHPFPVDIAKHIRDSKKMTATQREKLFEPLQQLCHSCIAEATIEEITKLNILWASMLAMQRAVAGLKQCIDTALIDGNRAPKLECQTITVIKGDDKSLSIAAASIIAKVARDRFMKKLALEYPGYGWERNAGYGTAAHLAALRERGLTPWHRDSFAPIAELKNLTS